MRARDNDYRPKLVYDFALPGSSPTVKFGDKRAMDITTGDIESYQTEWTAVPRGVSSGTRQANG